MTTIAANKCRDYLKRPARKVDSLSEQEMEYLEDQRGSPEAAALKEDSDMKVLIACEKLKEPYRTVAVSYFCKNIKLSDMARSTGQSLKTLQTQLYRAKKLLRLMWKEELM